MPCDHKPPRRALSQNMTRRNLWPARLAAGMNFYSHDSAASLISVESVETSISSPGQEHSKACSAARHTNGFPQKSRMFLCGILCCRFCGDEPKCLNCVHGKCFLKYRAMSVFDAQFVQADVHSRASQLCVSNRDSGINRAYHTSSKSGVDLHQQIAVGGSVVDKLKIHRALSENASITLRLRSSRISLWHVCAVDSPPLSQCVREALSREFLRAGL